MYKLIQNLEPELGPWDLKVLIRPLKTWLVKEKQANKHQNWTSKSAQTEHTVVWLFSDHSKKREHFRIFEQFSSKPFQEQDVFWQNFWPDRLVVCPENTTLCIKLRLWR